MFHSTVIFIGLPNKRKRFLIGLKYQLYKRQNAVDSLFIEINLNLYEVTSLLFRCRRDYMSQQPLQNVIKHNKESAFPLMHHTLMNNI